MRKLLIISVTAFLITSCAKQPLYSWYYYDKPSYDFLKNSDEKSSQDLMITYQKIIEKQKGTRGVPPPGIYADYGFLLLQANKTTQGKAMLQKEIELYPESKTFIDRILKTLEK
jgi:hypothetical protein